MSGTTVVVVVDDVNVVVTGIEVVVGAAVEMVEEDLTVEDSADFSAEPQEEKKIPLTTPITSNDRLNI